VPVPVQHPVPIPVPQPYPVPIKVSVKTWPSEAEAHLNSAVWGNTRCFHWQSYEIHKYWMKIYWLLRRLCIRSSEGE
jgi:hypothetical protein